MLPDYISGAQQWQQLVKMKDEEENDYNITLHRGVSIEHIDRENKLLTDSKGMLHSYDVLILATGSRADCIERPTKYAWHFYHAQSCGCR